MLCLKRLKHVLWHPSIGGIVCPLICNALVPGLRYTTQMKGWSIRQVDFNGTFLNSYIDNGEESLVELSNIRWTKFVGQLVKLFNSSYGIQQASKRWYKYLYYRLQKMGFGRYTESDSQVFLLSSKSNIIKVCLDGSPILEIHVICNNNQINDIVKNICKVLVIADLRKPKYVPCAQSSLWSDEIILSQCTRIQKAIHVATMPEKIRNHIHFLRLIRSMNI